MVAGTIFASCILTLLVLYYFSELNQGLCEESADHQYAWKYGPTAFLTILAALWQQIDYTCKSLEPWRNLARGSLSEKETLILDYLSVNSFNVILRAVRRRHWAVAASSAGNVILIHRYRILHRVTGAQPCKRN